jgi:hypothetical protein
MHTRIQERHYIIPMVSVLALSVTACFSSSGSGGGVDDVPDPDSFALSATVSGLGPGDLVLDVNGESLVVEEDGTVELASDVEEGSSFEVAVGEQPMAPLQACTVDPASGQIDGDTTVTIDCLTPIHLSGKLSTADAEDREVVLTAGTQSFTTTADADGHYSLDAELEDPWALLQLDSADGEIHFRSHIGSVVGLTERNELPVVDEVNRLHETETGRVNLNHLNTAMSGQLEWFNEGDAFEHHEALVDISRNLLTQDAANVAGALRMVTEGGLSLPGWADSTLAVALDLPAAIEWVNSLDGDGDSEASTGDAAGSLMGGTVSKPLGGEGSELEENTAAALDEASVASDGFTELPESMFVSGGHVFGRWGYAAQFDFLANQVWLREATGARLSGPFTLSDGDLFMNFEDDDDEPYWSALYSCPTEDGTVWCDKEFYYLDMTITQVMDGLSGNLIKRKHTTRVETTYHDDDIDDEVEIITEEEFVSLMVPGQNVILDESDLVGEIALAFSGDEFPVVDGARQITDIVTLESGGSGELQYYDIPIVWEVRTDGQLEIRPVGGSAIYQGWMISGSSDGEGYMLMDSAHSTEAGIVADRSMRRDDGLFFSGGDMGGRWELWRDEELNTQEPFLLDYNYTSDPNRAYLASESMLSTIPYRIEFNGNPEQPRYHLASCNGSSGWNAPDEIGLPDSPEEPDCQFVYREREWQIIREEGDRVYMTERQTFYQAVEEDDGAGGTEMVWQRTLDSSTIRYFSYIGDAEL